jgi:S-adenosylmethionine:diacylglycerol 3-amino-3-carboxypropyl transferase
VEHRLQLHHGNILEKRATLGAAHGPYDLLSLSNIADWMNEAQLTAMLGQAKAALVPGGSVLVRTANSSSSLLTVMAQQLQTDAALNAALPQIERGPWFRTIAAGFHPG